MSSSRLLGVLALAAAAGALLSACSSGAVSAGETSTNPPSTSVPTTAGSSTSVPGSAVPSSSTALAHDESTALTLLCGAKRPIPTFGGRPICGLFLDHAETSDGSGGTLYAVSYWAAQTSGAAAPIFFFDGEQLVTRTAPLIGGADVLVGAAGTAQFTVRFTAFKLPRPGAACADATAQAATYRVYRFDGSRMTVASAQPAPPGYTFSCIA